MTSRQLFDIYLCFVLACLWLGCLTATVLATFNP